MMPFIDSLRRLDGSAPIVLLCKLAVYSRAAKGHLLVSVIKCLLRPFIFLLRQSP